MIDIDFVAYAYPLLLLLLLLYMTSHMRFMLTQVKFSLIKVAADISF